MMLEHDPVADARTRASATLAGVPVTLERPSDPKHGDYATNVALRLAGRSGRPPREVADELAERAAALDGVARVEVAGPGFLNITRRRRVARERSSRR